VPADEVGLKKDLWFGKLDSEQTSNVEEYVDRRDESCEVSNQGNHRLA